MLQRRTRRAGARGSSGRCLSCVRALLRAISSPPVCGASRSIPSIESAPLHRSGRGCSEGLWKGCGRRQGRAAPAAARRWVSRVASRSRSLSFLPHTTSFCYVLVCAREHERVTVIAALSGSVDADVRELDMETNAGLTTVSATTAPAALNALTPSTDADGGPFLLRMPVELWTHVFDEKIEVTDLTLLRSICKPLRVVAAQLMPHVARRTLPAHAEDPRVADPFFAEALIAAHRLNVASPYQVLVARDGGIEPPRDPAAPKPAAKESRPTTKQSKLMTKKGKPIARPAGSTSSSATSARTDAPPSRKDWIIGSRRMLQQLHVRGRAWPFGICQSCKIGACARCLQPSGKLNKLDYVWWYRYPTQREGYHPYSNAISGNDALFCNPCASAESE